MFEWNNAGIYVEHIKIFDSLRGVMALWVALIHTLMTVGIFIPSILNKFVNVAFSVDIFIILSGFVIFFMLDRRQETYKSYITRRAFRLFPVYLIALIVSALTIDHQIHLWTMLQSEGTYWAGRLITLQNSSEYFLPQLAVHLILAQGLFGNFLPTSDFTFIEPAWSLSLEWQFYLLAPVIFAACSGAKRYVTLLLFLSLASALLYGQGGSGFLPNRIHYFMVGMASFFVYKNAANERGRILPIAMLYASFMLRNIPMIVWSAFLSIAVYRSPVVVSIRRFFEMPIFQYFGNVSYPIYVLHTLAVYPAILLSKALTDHGSPGGNALIVFMTLFATLVLAHLAHRFIEVPSMNYGKRLAASIGQ